MYWSPRLRKSFCPPAWSQISFGNTAAFAQYCESPAYSFHVFKGSARSFSESAQRWRTEGPDRDSRRQQSSLRRYSEGRGSRGKRSNQPSAILVSRLHNFNRLRFAIDGIADRITDPRTSRNHRRAAHHHVRRTAPGNNSWCLFSRGCRASPRSQAQHNSLANLRSSSEVFFANAHICW